MRLAPVLGARDQTLPGSSLWGRCVRVRVCVVCAFIMASVPYCVPGGGCGWQTPAVHPAGPGLHSSPDLCKDSPINGTKMAAAQKSLYGAQGGGWHQGWPGKGQGALPSSATLASRRGAKIPVLPAGGGAPPWLSPFHPIVLQPVSALSGGCWGGAGGQVAAVKAASHSEGQQLPGSHALSPLLA